MAQGNITGYDAYGRPIYAPAPADPTGGGIAPHGNPLAQPPQPSVPITVAQPTGNTDPNRAIADPGMAPGTPHGVMPPAPPAPPAAPQYDPRQDPRNIRARAARQSGQPQGAAQPIPNTAQLNPGVPAPQVNAQQPQRPTPNPQYAAQRRYLQGA